MSGGSHDVVLAAAGLTKHFPVRRRPRDLFAGGRRAVHAVDDVSLELRRGRVTAMVGESGSGKSTVARLLAQLYPRTSGTVSLHGKPITVHSGRRFRAYCGKVQLVFQDPFASLNPAHTVRYHLSRALRLHGRPATDASVLLEQVQLTPPERFLDAFPHELSGGQRQRVAIARSLAAEPEVLLADEPVSMLDVSIRLGILNLLRELRDRLNLAILYITHDIASARYFADEILVMYAGRVVEGGDSETLTQHPAHPYTQLLISSAPDPDQFAGWNGHEGRLHGTGRPEGVLHGTGDPPSLISPPSGCRFHPRCPHAMAVCAERLPPRLPVPGDTGQWAACWLYDRERVTVLEHPLPRTAPEEAG